ncbi:hypothetical protein EYF80_010485 [Liparis tanakae]|uniref:Uncharacterized protein n=1 Tax=Liparis tanakae TaxID=230148 RepID=A0A4Z2IMH1_9TELE|nr:hypothetical protein EYF80_010485 [Liparis tanakae]
MVAISHLLHPVYQAVDWLLTGCSGPLTESSWQWTETGAKLRRRLSVTVSRDIAGTGKPLLSGRHEEKKTANSHKEVETKSRAQRGKLRLAKLTNMVLRPKDPMDPHKTGLNGGKAISFRPFNHVMTGPGPVSVRFEHSEQPFALAQQPSWLHQYAPEFPQQPKAHKHGITLCYPRTLEIERCWQEDKLFPLLLSHTSKPASQTPQI